MSWDWLYVALGLIGLSVLGVTATVCAIENECWILAIVFIGAGIWTWWGIIKTVILDTEVQE